MIKNYIKKIVIELVGKLIDSSLDKKIIDAEKQIQRSIDRLDWFMTEYHTTVCSNPTCKKNILAHYGGFYRNFEGKVYCSNECLNKLK